MVTRHALVVDDDPDNRDALSQILESQGYAVRHAENGKVALDMIREYLPCLMLLDLQMPVMSGWEVLARLHDVARKTLAVVVLSAAASAPPNVMFLRKPCEIDHLLDTIRASHELQREQVRIDGPPRPEGSSIGFAGVPGPGQKSMTTAPSETRNAAGMLPRVGSWSGLAPGADFFPLA